MRVFVFGLIAAVLSAAAWFAIEYFSRMEFPWLAIVVGLATGWGVHRGAQAGVGTGYGRGALAAIVALVAIVGGRQLYASIIQATHDNAAGIARAVEVVEEDAVAEVPAGGAAEESDVAPVVVESIIQERAVDVPAGPLNAPVKVGGSDLDMVWMCVGALAAYLIGKGSGSPVAAPHTSEAPAPM